MTVLIFYPAGLELQVIEQQRPVKTPRHVVNDDNIRTQALTLESAVARNLGGVIQQLINEWVINGKLHYVARRTIAETADTVHEIWVSFQKAPDFDAFWTTRCSGFDKVLIPATSDRIVPTVSHRVTPTRTPLPLTTLR